MGQLLRAVLIVNLGGPSEIAGRRRHFAHRLDERDYVVLFDVDVLDNFNEKIGFFGFIEVALFSLCLRAFA